jgi:ribosomal subunit interface protein
MTRKRASLAPAPNVQVTVRQGHIPSSTQDYAAKKIGHVASYSDEPVLFAHIVMNMVADPARERPAQAEATLDVNGTPVRAHVAAKHMLEAVDMLEDRLRRQLVQLEDRVRTRHNWIGLAEDHEWRHGDLPTARPEYFPRPVEDRTVVKRKTFAVEAATPDEAAYDMDLVGHDFWLFTDLSTGREAVIHRLPEGGYGLRGTVGEKERTQTISQVAPEGPAPTMTDKQAVAHLDVGGEPFVFYLDPGTGRGRVLYRRYDGHYGLITPA